MPHYKFHFCTYRDETDLHYASLLEWVEPVAIGRTKRDAVSDLKQYMRWRYDKSAWMGEPEFTAEEVHVVHVRLRPAYEQNQRRFPMSRAFRLPVHVVTGKLSYGGQAAILPLLNERLEFHRTDDLGALVQFVVQRRLDGNTPQELARHVPPGALELGSFSFHVGDDRSGPRESPPPPLLSTLADPVAGRQIRSLYGKAWQRDAAVQDLTARLRTPHTNVLLVGPAGVGKSTILVNAARECERVWAEQRKGQATEPSQRRRFWQTNAGRLIAGMKYLGEWEARTEAVIEELARFEGLLCIENLADLIQTGGANAQSGLASFCMPFLQRRELRMIAEATPAELDACRRLLPGFDDLFQVQMVEPMSGEDCIAALRQHTLEVSRSHKLELDARDIASTAVHLFKRFLPYRALPGEASRFLSDLLERRVRQRETQCESDDVRDAFIEHTGLDRRFVDAQVRLLRNDVDADLLQGVIGQDAACRVVTDMVLRFKAGLCDPQRPLGVLLFCGPTGVGKTELARSVAKYLFGGASKQRTGAALDPEQAAQRRFIRLDMSEYSGPTAAERLLRQANGDLSPFLQQVRQHPFCVVLLDEVEKANPAVYDVLLNVFDEGRISDEYGRVTYFRNSVLIMTSNLGARKKDSVGFDKDGPGVGGEVSSRRYTKAVMDFFRPEFVNRIDAVIPFDPLSLATIRQITEKELRQIANREGLRRRGIELAWDQAVVDRLGELGHDARYGARPLQRAIETIVVSRLSLILSDASLSDVQVRLTLVRGNVELSVEGM